MIERFFAFGCSYTQYAYPTWADFIGVNYKEYYNYGRAGASNTYIMNRVVEYEHLHQFNSDTDFVVIMLTGFGRFSFIEQKEDRNYLQWATYGELNNFYYQTKNKKVEYFLKYIWTDDFAVYQSWISVNVIKELLTRKNIKHKILMGIDNSLYKDHNDITNLSDIAINFTNEIYNTLDIPLTFDEWKKTKPFEKESVFWENINSNDGHPSPNVYFNFVQEFFHEELTDLSYELKNYWEKNIDHTSQSHQGEKFCKYFTDVFYESNNKTIF